MTNLPISNRSLQARQTEIEQWQTNTEHRLTNADFRSFSRVRCFHLTHLVHQDVFKVISGVSNLNIKCAGRKLPAPLLRNIKRFIQFLFLSLLVVGCQQKNTTHSYQKERLELIPEPDKIENTEVEILDSIESETTTPPSKKLEPIRLNFQRVNKTKKWSSIEELKLYASTEGGIAHFFYLNDTLLKVIERHLGETGQILREYYLLNGAISFVLEMEIRYNRPIYRDSSQMKSNRDTETFDASSSDTTYIRNYFENGKMIWQKKSAQNNTSIDQKHLEKEQYRIQKSYDELVSKQSRGSE